MIKLPHWLAASYQQSLKSYMGYVADSHWASDFDDHFVNVLGRLLIPGSPELAEFMSRYPRDQRPWREPQVKQAICLWLCEFAVVA